MIFLITSTTVLCMHLQTASLYLIYYCGYLTKVGLFLYYQFILVVPENSKQGILHHYCEWI